MQLIAHRVFRFKIIFPPFKKALAYNPTYVYVPWRYSVLLSMTLNADMISLDHAVRTLPKWIELLNRTSRFPYLGYFFSRTQSYDFDLQRQRCKKLQSHE
jgi:hypothetical protein